MCPTRVFEAKWLRNLLLEALPKEFSSHGETPEPQFVYLPASHGKALHPNASVVIGIRGVGKSFWCSALQEPQIRTLVSELAPHVGVAQNMRIAVGFGARSEPDSYPGRDTLDTLLKTGISARLIWRTVIAFHVDSSDGALRGLKTWEERIRWVQSNPETVEHIFAQRDAEFDAEGTWFMILFDALERSAATRQQMNQLIRGLLEVALEFRPYRRLRVKCFLRTDQVDETRVADFPDASKVLSTSVELNWTREDLFGLLWQYLGNANGPDSEQFVEISSEKFGVEWDVATVGSIRINRVSPWNIADENAQRDLFHAIAGSWMGRDPRRGFPYTWIPSHLADASGKVSPRSFLAALREAAEDTHSRYPGYEFALHYESIKRGVQSASQIRIRELTEDYPWVDALMRPLHSAVVPCDFSDVVQRWQTTGVIDALHASLKDSARLLPVHFEEGIGKDGEDFHGLRKDLEELGIFRRTYDGRVDIPDVFRVGYGLGRRGGVKPLSTRTNA